MRADRLALAWVLRVVGVVVLAGATLATVDISRTAWANTGAFVWGGVISDMGFRFATGAISLAVAELLLAAPPRQTYRLALAWFLRVVGVVVLLGVTLAVLDFTSLFAAKSTVFLWGGVIGDFGYRFATGASSLAAAELLLTRPR